MWCVKEIDEEYRRRMYDVLDLYEQKYDPKRPVIGIDEKPKTLRAEKRAPIPMKPGTAKNPGKPEKVDYEYVRKGKANIFMAVNFKAGKRTTQVTEQRTKRDFAFFVKHLADKVYPKADILRLVVDNLNTHFESSFTETFGKREAERILSRIEFHYTPTHGSWLNVAEIEINVMDIQCTRRWIGDRESLAREVAAWNRKRDREQKRINWRFTKKDAKRVFPEENV